jgi:hypothetical protein
MRGLAISRTSTKACAPGPAFQQITSSFLVDPLSETLHVRTVMRNISATRHHMIRFAIVLSLPLLSLTASCGARNHTRVGVTRPYRHRSLEIFGFRGTPGIRTLRKAAKSIQGRSIRQVYRRGFHSLVRQRLRIVKCAMSHAVGVFLDLFLFNRTSTREALHAAVIRQVRSGPKRSVNGGRQDGIYACGDAELPLTFAIRHAAVGVNE